MKTTSLMAGASRFAHFAGLTRASRRAADDDNKKQGRRADEDDDDKDADEGDDDQPKGKHSRRAADDDDDKQGRASDDDGDDDSNDGDDNDGKDADDGDDDQPKGKRSRSAAEDDDDDKDADDDEDELKGKGATATARRREQSRIAHILGHKAAAGNPVLAVSLACETRMTRQEAVRVLKSQPASQSAGDDRPNRHARTDRSGRNVRLGSDAAPLSGTQAVSNSWDKAFAKAGVTPRT